MEDRQQWMEVAAPGLPENYLGVRLLSHEPSVADCLDGSQH